MSYSLNEIQALCTRAARGAGSPWGMAQDAGRAARCLAQAGLPGATLLAGLLEIIDGADISDFSPKLLHDEIWRAPHGLSPLAAGAALSDTASRLNMGQGVTLENLHFPLLLALFLRDAARQIAHPIMAEWPGGRVVTDGGNLAANGKVLETPQAERCVISRSQVPFTPLSTTFRATPSAEVLSRLNSFAQRTYAPATEESRNRGAGAGNSDND